VFDTVVATYQDIREAIRDRCSSFPPDCFRKIDEARGYPVEFVDAPTKAGWLAALIPQEYGGSGLGLPRSF
jgi:acyl-CoA dehydrogenase